MSDPGCQPMAPDDAESAMAAAAFQFSPYVGTLVLQPTPLCNMRCTYCYLPDLSDRSRMDPAIPRLLADELALYPRDQQVVIRWHGGEPLTAGISHLSSLLEPFEPLRLEGRLRHTLQTNGTLITDAWCELFRRYEIGVGISIDGPRWANRARRSLSGAEAFERTVSGVARLRTHGVRFTTIAVVAFANIPEIVDRADEYLEFFHSIGTDEVGFNVEEREGHHCPSSTAPDLVVSFWQAVFDAWMKANCRPRVRDFDRVLEFARSSLDGPVVHPLVDPFPTVTWRGDVVLLSPELAGYRDERYDDFVVGSLNDAPLGLLLERGLKGGYVQDFCKGAERCRSDCPYFDYCLAGSASNRYFEHGDFVTNETEFCQYSRQMPFDVVVGIDRSTAQRARSLP